jgi:hypothetical protein
VTKLRQFPHPNMHFELVINTIKPIFKILATLHGGYKTKANWMTNHIDLEKWYWKNKYFIVSSWWQKTRFLLPWQFRFARLFFGENYSLPKVSSDTLICKEIFYFQSLLLLSTETSGWINAFFGVDREFTILERIPAKFNWTIL